MPIKSFPRPASAEQVLPALLEDGVVILERTIADAVMDRLMAEIEPHLADCPIAGGDFFGGKCKRLKGLAAKSPAAGELITDPSLLAIADAVLLESCSSYRVQVLGVLQVWPGGELQPLHRDTGVYQPYFQVRPGDKPVLVSMIWAASDFTAVNGATRLVPGSHEWPAERVATEDEIVQAVMPRGSAVVWIGSLLHGMGINRSDRPRTGIVSGFCVGWLRQEENQYLATPPDVAAELPEDVQRLLGYRAHSPILGWAEDRDPDLLLGPRMPDHDAEGYGQVEQDMQKV